MVGEEKEQGHCGPGGEVKKKVSVGVWLCGYMGLTGVVGLEPPFPYLLFGGPYMDFFHQTAGRAWVAQLRFFWSCRFFGSSYSPLLLCETMLHRGQKNILHVVV